MNQSGAPGEAGVPQESPQSWDQDAPHGEHSDGDHGQSQAPAYAVQAAPPAPAPEPSGETPASNGPKGFFRALKEGAKSLRRNDGESQSEAPPSAAPPAPLPAPTAAPQPAHAEPQESEPSGPSRKGWWDAKE